MESDHSPFQIVLSRSTFKPQDPGLYFIADGVVRVQYMVLEHTSRVLIQRLGQGSIFGSHGLITSHPPQCTFVVDSDRATIKHIGSHQLLHTLEAGGDLLVSKFYRELALDLALIPSTMIFTSGVWEAFPY